MNSAELDSDIAYKCNFCDVIFPKFESILKHNKLFCHKRRKLPRSCTVTTAMLTSPRSPDESAASQRSNSDSCSDDATASSSGEESMLVPKFDNSSQVDRMDTSAPKREYVLPRGPGVVAVVRLSQSGTTLLGSHVPSKLPQAAADFKHPTSAALTLQRLHARSRFAVSSPPFPNEHVRSQILHAAAEFMHPRSAAITLQRMRMQSSMAEAATCGRIFTGGATLHHEQMHSNVLEAKRDSESPESSTKRKKLSDDDN